MNTPKKVFQYLFTVNSLRLQTVATLLVMKLLCASVSKSSINYSQFSFAK